MDWWRVSCVQRVCLSGGEGPMEEDGVVGSIILVLDELCSDSVGVDILCDCSSEIGDKRDGEVVRSSVVDLD